MNVNSIKIRKRKSGDCVKKLSTSLLKWIAAVTMFIDHTAAIFEPSNPIYSIMRGIGRITFPIFAFVLVEGFIHTRNRQRYMLRMFIFAVITEFCFDLAFFGKIIDFSYQNVLFTFLISLFALDLYERSSNKIIGFLFILLGMVLATVIITDYYFFGVLMVFSFYFFRNRIIPLSISLFVINGLMAVVGVIQLFAIFSIPFIAMYNGEKGRTNKYLFYVFYPGHLLVLYLLHTFVM